LRPLSVNDRHAYDRSNAFDFIQQPRAGVALRSVRMSTQTTECVRTHAKTAGGRA
jgi:hypothetical protein